MQHHTSGLSLLLISAGIVTTAHAQPQPLPNNPAQEILLQQQRERELREQMDSTANVRTPELPQAMSAQTRIPDQESPCFTIEHIELAGELSEKFRFALNAADDGPDGKDPATNRCLGTEGINIVMSRVQNVIIEKGYITTRIFAAPQDLNEGTLTLTLVPGRIRSIRWGEGSQICHGTFNVALRFTIFMRDVPSPYCSSSAGKALSAPVTRLANWYGSAASTSDTTEPCACNGTTPR